VPALLVEDDEMLGRSLGQALEGAGWSVDWVRDGELGESALATATTPACCSTWACPGRMARSTGALQLDLTTREVLVDGVREPLTAREFALLHALLQRPGAILSRDQLEQRIYGWARRSPAMRSMC
jgi:DNA-binding response OmpR family regulator